MNDYEYWGEVSEYDSAVESLKDSLRESVKDEITERIARLTADNAALKERLRGLDAAEREAAQAKTKYEREFSSAKSEAVRTVRKEELGKLLDAIDERLYRVERVSAERPKCDLCDERRRIAYKTPRGRDVTEMCVCSDKDAQWEVTEVVAHEVARRDGALTVWWVTTRRADEEYQLSPKMLKRAENSPIEDILKQPYNYSFPDRPTAQALAEKLNAAGDSDDHR